MQQTGREGKKERQAESKENDANERSWQKPFNGNANTQTLKDSGTQSEEREREREGLETLEH